MTQITATTRLARELRYQYDQQQVAAGLSTWAAPDILPFAAWLRRLWTDGIYAGRSAEVPRLLRGSEERTMWEDIVGNQADSVLLEVAGTAEAAMNAWRLLCEWEVPLDSPEWGDSADSEVFQSWARQFRCRCDHKAWVSEAELAGSVASRIEAGTLSLPETVEVAGFLELTPVQQRVFNALSQRGVDVVGRPVPERVGEAVRIGLIDADREVRAAACWARRILETDPEAAVPDFRIGVIVADLERRRSRVEGIFAEECHPGYWLRPEMDRRRLFNISLGLPLTDYPIIAAAFRFLDVEPQQIRIEDAGRLLRSPFIARADVEWSSRALLDGALCAMREPLVSLNDLMHFAGTEGEPFGCPGLVEILGRWGTERESLNSLQLPSDWAASVSRLLAMVGWPGDRGLNSAEFQSIEVWNEVLSELAGLDGVLGRVRFERAIGMLRTLATARLFQPESEAAPIQILGVFEASGLRFDRLWIMGMHDLAWPGSTGPEPFLPLRLQRRLNLPRCSPERELAYTQVLTARLLASAPQIVVSHPDREADSDLRVSPLFSGLTQVSADALEVTATVRYLERLQASSRMETIEDPMGPPTGDAAVLGGGTSIFKLQAMCPFKAFSELRLAATPPAKSEPGLGALDRGQLIHRVLERIWKTLGSHDALLSAGAAQTSEMVRGAVGAEIQRLSANRRALRSPKFAAIEQTRLENLVTEWLDLERAREPFTVLEQEARRRVSVGGIQLHIRADRVDRLSDGRRVILDYKSGDCRRSQWDGPRPDEPQLPIYAVTAESEVAGVFFGRLKAGKVGFVGVSDAPGIVPGGRESGRTAPMDEVIDAWRGVLEQLGEAFRAGAAAVDPKDRNSTCQHCHLPTLCRISRPRDFAGDAAGVAGMSEGPDD